MWLGYLGFRQKMSLIKGFRVSVSGTPCGGREEPKYEARPFKLHL
jgi:hypothetical protein